MKRSVLVVLAALVMAASTEIAAGSQNGHGGNQVHGHDVRPIDRRDRARYFAPGDLRLLRGCYRPRYHELPPGLQKKLYRTGRLPPGWERKMRPFPWRVERRLVGLPPYYRRGFLDRYAVVYYPRTRVIVDIQLVGR